MAYDVRAIKPSFTIFVKFLKIRTPEKFAVITLKFEQGGFTIRVMHPKDVDRVANTEDPDQFELGLHCLPRPICPKT